ncbi:MAG: hypothetical protein PHI12_00035 [Dehalococcoidales bacterium]|nr:hypothetical protein [Dehalococcoidales bacterium]
MTKKIAVLTVSESKRLIAKGVANLDIVKNALGCGIVAIAKGTTNGYVVEELLNKGIDKTVYVLGRVLPEKMENTYDFSPSMNDIVLKDGKLVGISVIEAVHHMGENDVFIKGCNILNYEKRIAGVLKGSGTGGTIGATIEVIKRNKINLVLPVGIEKSSGADIYSIRKELEEGVTWRGSLLRLEPLTGTIVTEIEALEILTGVKAIQVSAGGIGGAEGSVRLLLKGKEGQVQEAEDLIEDIQGEPPFLKLLG